MIDLQEKTHTEHYENFRREKLTVLEMNGEGLARKEDIKIRDIHEESKTKDYAGVKHEILKNEVKIDVKLSFHNHVNF